MSIEYAEGYDAGKKDAAEHLRSVALTFRQMADTSRRVHHPASVVQGYEEKAQLLEHQASVIEGIGP